LSWKSDQPSKDCLKSTATQNSMIKAKILKNI